MTEAEFVAGAQQLLHSPFWQQLERTMRDRAVARFEASAAADDETRREAHMQLMALKNIRRECENRIAKYEHDRKAP
ncbi:MAG: hypothetical protein ACO3LD_03455 [Luminiphilus sp.]|jgi:hypothetical protein